MNHQLSAERASLAELSLTHPEAEVPIEAQVSIRCYDKRSYLEAAILLQIRWPDREVSCTAERLLDVVAVVVAASSYVVEGVMNGQSPPDAGDCRVSTCCSATHTC